MPAWFMVCSEPAGVQIGGDETDADQRIGLFDGDAGRFVTDSADVETGKAGGGFVDGAFARERARRRYLRGGDQPVQVLPEVMAAGEVVHEQTYPGPIGEDRACPIC